MLFLQQNMETKSQMADLGNTDIKIDIKRAMASSVGAEHGVSPADMKELAPRIDGRLKLFPRAI